MAEKVLMTALSPTMDEGTIVSWSKSEGDTVAAGDVLCEVETDKASMEYESTQEGTLLKIVRGAGETANVGEVIAIIGESGEDISELVAEAERAGAGAASVEGAAPSTSAAPAEGVAPTASATAGAAEADTRVSPAEQVGPAEQVSPAEQPSPVAEPGAAPPPPVAGGERVKASPLARKLAEQRGIDLRQVSGSGPGGRIVKDDLEGFTPAAVGATATAGAGAPAAGAAAGFTAAAVPGRDETVAVSRRRAVIAKRLAESKFSAPHFYLSLSVDMGAVTGAREALNRELPQKAGLNAFLIKFAAEALRRHPGVNASWQGETILQHGSIDIGLAVDAGSGLITPVVRNCANKGVAQIDAELKELIEKAQNDALQPEEYSGATFTISNLGAFGIEEFTAIINPPGSAILAVGKTQKTVVVDDDEELVVRPLMKLTLSCDHRVIDGAAGARFLNDLKALMEQPYRALF